ncbi:hypothetical protein [Bernardetia sp. MNP-M8]|uniref:hypothetical protein n=1 Tax=Bernardetia sp. MNP-M8 TaxID=3127470 RepID=UPI0030CE9A86
MSFSQNTESQEEEIIKNIRQEYNSIQENKSTYDTTTVDIMGESTEGGQLVGYYDIKNNRELKVINMTWLGEAGKHIFTFYLKNDKLFFIFEQHFEYNTSIYMTKEVAKENEIAAFDIRKSKVEENRYYFDNGKLFRWINPKREKVDLQIEENITKEKELKKEFVRLSKKLKK